MIKKIVIILFAVALAAYILFSAFFMNSRKDNTICKNIDVIVVDTLKSHFIGKNEIENMLKKSGMTLIGKKMSEINTELIESKLEENKLIKKAECYKTTGGSIKIEIYQKAPIMRVISTYGSYYIDNEGTVMPISDNFSAHLPVATGYIDKEFATTKLYNFALFLQNNKYWNAQIEQINVLPNKDIELTTRVGDFQVLLGQLDDYEANLDKLKLFYDKGLNKVGWNRYSVINLKYKNQVVCTKK
ncbi:MAG: cell division protein FtsQ/DivIB [Candidatus Azobacteroides sp.]|nr:cell division protein FtsQ/DivIB [Candidatus Azobacteroides sp.]